MKGLFFFESVGVPRGSPELGKGNLGWGPLNVLSELKVLKMFWCFEKFPRPKMI